MDAVIPPLRGSSVYYKSLNPLPEEYSKFMDQFKEGNILLAFGTTFAPGIEQIQGLLDGAKMKPNTGFIFSIAKNYETHNLVKDAKLPNVLLKEFLP
jgi:hypothetical protein